LPLWFQNEDIGMKVLINLSTRDAMIASILSSNFSLKTIEGLGKLESYILSPNPFISEEEVTMSDLIILDGPLKGFNRSDMS
jgi:hypothetical protein